MIKLEQISLICEYIAWQKCLTEESTAADYAHLNALSLCCMATLPSSIWASIILVVKDNKAGSAIKLALLLRDVGDQIPEEHYVWHAPRIGSNFRNH